MQARQILSVEKPPLVFPEPQSKGLWGAIRRFCWGLHGLRAFKIIVNLLIIINMIITAIPLTYHEKIELYLGFDMTNIFLMIIMWAFVLECAIKMVAVTPKVFFRIFWYKYLLAVSVLSVTAWFFETIGVSPVVWRAIGRTVTVARMFRLIPQIKPILTFTEALVYSTRDIISILPVLGVLIIAYSYVGKYLFGSIKYHEYITPQMNFRRFSSSLFVLLNALTLDGWTVLMRGCGLGTGLSTAHACTVEEGFNDCGSRLATPFWMSYYIIASYIILTMVIVIVLCNFTVGYGQNQTDALVPQEDIQDFKQVWEEYDTTNSGKIRFTDLANLLRRLKEKENILGFDPDMDRFMFFRPVQQKLLELSDPMQGGRRLAFEHCLLVLALFSLDSDYLTHEEQHDVISSIRSAAAARIQAWYRMTADKIQHKDKLDAPMDVISLTEKDTLEDSH